MTGFMDCVAAAVRAGKVTPDRARAAREEFDRLVARGLRAQLSQTDAELRASDELIAKTLSGFAARRNAALRHVDTIRRNEALFAATKDDDLILKRVEDIERMQRSLEKSLMRDIGQFVAAFRADIFGRVAKGSEGGRALLRDVVRALHGEAVGNALPRARSPDSSQKDRDGKGGR